MKTALKQYKKPLLALLLLIALLGLYFTRDKWMMLFSKKEPVKTNSSSSTTSSSNNKNPILQMGSRGEKVRQLQQLLNEKHRSNAPQFRPLLVEDGIFGQKTQNMLKKWTGKTQITIPQLILELK